MKMFVCARKQYYLCAVKKEIMTPAAMRVT
jgi:hypothetical protein